MFRFQRATVLCSTACASGLVLLLLAAPAHAQAEGAACVPNWKPTFGSHPGTDGPVYDFAVFDEGIGGGPKLFLAGDFDRAGGVTARGVARRDLTTWSALGQGIQTAVYALEVFDDGSGGGPALYAAGGFLFVDGTLLANNIARWDGSSWTTLSGGTNDLVRSLAVFDDGRGGGPALYAGGQFTTAGGGPASHLARWDGASWTPLGSGTNGEVLALAVFDDGGGPALYAGGDFTLAGGAPASRIAKWDGASWSAVGGGVTGGFGTTVWALHSFDDGNWSALYVGGTFTSAGGVPAGSIAQWDGTSWTALGVGTIGSVRALATFDEGGGAGPALFAAGLISNIGGVPAVGIARWDGASWSILGNGVNAAIYGLGVFDAGDGEGPGLYAGGDFISAGGVPADGLARWDGSRWWLVGGGVNDWVHGLLTFDDGSGPALYVGGQFKTAGSEAASCVARFDGTGWSPLGSGTDLSVRALEGFDDGSGGGPLLHVGGGFGLAGGVPASRVAKWDGSNWSPLGSGVNDRVDDLVVFDDGGGPALYASGAFTTAGGLPANRVARWDGTSWSTLGPGTNGTVRALAVFDDGNGGGPALYAGGEFTTAGGVAASRLAKWNGAGWSSVGHGTNGPVQALAVFDDGNGGGPALYVGGLFSSAGSVAANQIARWDGSSWSPLGAGVNDTIQALSVFDDDSGSGPALYAGGAFSMAGGVPAARIAKWDGASWTPLGSGLSGSVTSLAVFDGGLVAGGLFSLAPDSGDSYVARWSCTPSPWTDLGGGTTGSAGPPVLTMFGPLTSPSIVTLDLDDAAPLELAIVFISFASTPAPFLGGTLHALPVDFLVVVATDALGGIHGSAFFPGAPSGTELWFQVGIQDLSVPIFGASLSNGVKGTVP